MLFPVTIGLKINHKNIVRSKERVHFVPKPTSKTKNSHLPKSVFVSSVNKPNSVGIDPVSSLEAIKIIRGKISENKLEAKKE